MPTAADTSASQHLKRIPAAVRPTVQAARRAVKSAVPKANEMTYRTSGVRSPKSRAMYKVFRYVVDDVQVAGLGTFPTHASLFFRRGSELDDDSGLLEGSGKARFIRLRTPADAARPAVKRIVRQASKLGGAMTSGKER